MIGEAPTTGAQGGQLVAHPVWRVLIERAGGKRLPTATLLKGFPIPRGACFSTPGGEPPA